MPRKVASLPRDTGYHDLKSKAAARATLGSRLQLDSRRQESQSDEVAQLHQTLSSKIDHIEKNASHQRASALKGIRRIIHRICRLFLTSGLNCCWNSALSSCYSFSLDLLDLMVSGYEVGSRSSFVEFKSRQRSSSRDARTIFLMLLRAWSTQEHDWLHIFDRTQWLRIFFGMKICWVNIFVCAEIDACLTRVRKRMKVRRSTHWMICNAVIVKH